MKPISKIELLGLRVAGASGAFLELRVRQRGLRFRPDERFLEDLRDTGPQNSLIEAVRSARIEAESAESQDELGIQAKLARCGKLTHDEHFAEAEIECRAALAMAPNNPFLLSAVSFVLTREEKGDEALAFARRAVNLDSSLATARFRVGAALQATGDLNAADTVYRRILELEPDDIDAMVALGSLAEKKHDLEAAMAHFREALRTQPNSVNAHYQLASALHEKGDATGERTELEEVVRLAPDFAEAHYHLGITLQKQGEHEAAASELREAIRLQPDFPDAHQGLGDELRLKGDLEGAFAEWSQPVRLHPADAEAHLFLGTMLAGNKKLDEGIPELREAIRLKPDHAFAHYFLGLALRDKGDAEGAIRELRESVRLRSENGEARLALADTLLATRAPQYLDEAISHYRQLLRQDPGSSEAHMGLATALFGKQDLDSCIKELREAGRLDPKNVKARLLLGTALDARGDSEAAIVELREALRLDPDNSKAPVVLGEVLSKKEQDKEALSQLREAVRLDPGSSDAHRLLGVALYQSFVKRQAVTRLVDPILRILVQDGKVKDPRVEGLDDLETSLTGAISELRQAVRLNPSDAQVHDSLGEALTANNELDAGIGEFSEAVSLEPGSASSIFIWAWRRSKKAIRKVLSSSTARQSSLTQENLNIRRHSNPCLPKGSANATEGPMNRKNLFFVVSMLAVLTGCLGSIAPITDSSESDDALLGTWRQCQGMKIQITRAGADSESGGYMMKATDRETHKSITYRLFIQRIGNDEYADVSYAPRYVKADEFPAVHVIALIRHDGNDLLFRPMNDEWWDNEHLDGSGLKVVEAGDELYLILGRSSDLRSVLAAHGHDPHVFLGEDKVPTYGRLKRQWTAAEAEGCDEDLR